MTNDGATISTQKLHGLLSSDFVSPFHPFKEYFNNLPEWDGHDHIQRLSEQVQTSDQDYWEFCLKKWLVALVASALDEKVVNHVVLILQGKQGLGKTTVLLGLVPHPLKDYVYSGTLNPTDKDTMIQLSETILCNLDELETLTKYKEGALKEIITKGEIRIRRPYGRFTEKLTRHASLCGSVNDGAVLQDPTGSRRFLIHSVESINYDHDVCMDAVYAQALHLYNDGFRYWFDQDEIKQIHAQNKRFESQSVEEELLLTHFEKADVSDRTALKLSSTEILKAIHGQKLPSNAHGAKIRIGQALSKDGFNHVNHSGVKCWLVRNNSRGEWSGLSDPTSPTNVGSSSGDGAEIHENQEAS